MGPAPCCRSLDASSDEGEYVCSAANVYGEVRTTTALEVIRRASTSARGNQVEGVVKEVNATS